MDELLWQLSDKLRRVNHRQMFMISRMVSELGIVPSEHFALMQLSRAGRVTSQAQVAQMLHVSPARVTLVMKDLEEGGYIERDSADGRRYEIAITPKGEDMVQRSCALFQRLNEACYAGLREDELSALSGCLDHILENLSHMESEDKRGGNL